MTIELVPLCIATAILTDPFILPGTPTGSRVIAEVEDLVLEGDRLRAKRKGGAAADWMTLSSAMVGTLDVRALLETDDGALIFTWYHGRFDLSNGVGGRPAYAAPLYETGDERYTWLNTIQAIAKGELSNDGKVLTYEIYEVR
jgi:hypothetical protein